MIRFNQVAVASFGPSSRCGLSPAGFTRLTPHIISWIKDIAGLNKVQGFKCIDGWTYNSKTRKCYKYFEKKNSWRNAKNDCQSIFTRGISSSSTQIHGTLAFTKDEEEKEFVLKYAKCLRSGLWLVNEEFVDGCLVCQYLVKRGMQDL